MASDYLIVERAGAVAVVTVNRPEVLNALNVAKRGRTLRVRVERMQKPVVAPINGFALGDGA